jgi:hypothetical protein
MIRKPETTLEKLLYAIAFICSVSVLVVILGYTFKMFGL